MSLLMSRARARLTPGTVAALVAVGDLLVCGVLLLVGLGSIGAAPTTGAEESAAWESAGWLYAGWLVGGLVLFAALWRTLGALVHVAAMLVSPFVVVFVPIGLSALLR
ncbi:hypothetical protein [Streptomyces sp. NPDC050145]|uniref:hypothetical protein n=1 Tax=Streptomyces sp. NPDC050145 TaxID=3365602 RepID=UPI0037B97C0A